MSSALVRSWLNTLSCAMDIDHSRPHRARPKPRTKSENYRLFRRILRQVISALAELTPTDERAKVIRGDSAMTIAAMPASSVDLVLSSPPYANAIDYPRAHKFSE